MQPAKKVKKILIIDDEPDTITFLATWLEDQGYLTCSATDGHLGMEMIRSEAPDLVLMDVKMPGRTGMQLYRDIRTDPAFAELPVIFISGVAEYHLFSRDCEQLPEPTARLDKPVDLNALQNAINLAWG
jgi:CheY-like chemotaxis protein